MNTKSILQALLTPAMLLAFQGQAHAQMYAYTDLGSGEANAINSAGQVVGDNLNGVAVLWNGTTETSLGKMGQWDIATGIDSGGKVVGYFVCGCETYAAQWNGVAGSQLAKGDFGAAKGINNAGQAIGYEYDIKSPNSDQAVIWSGSTITTLNTAGNFSSSVGTAINNQYVTVTGTAWDVAYMDANLDSNNTVY